MANIMKQTLDREVISPRSNGLIVDLSIISCSESYRMQSGQLVWVKSQPLQTSVGLYACSYFLYNHIYWRNILEKLYKPPDLSKQPRKGKKKRAYRGNEGSSRQTITQNIGKINQAHNLNPHGLPHKPYTTPIECWGDLFTAFSAI